MSAAPVVLPPLVQAPSGNRSTRGGAGVDLLVWHETGGSYAGAVSWLRNPRADASAHLVIREDGAEATQLVPLAEKAWHAVAYNPRSIGVEHANVTGKHYATEAQLLRSARVFAWLCWHLHVPPRWAHGGAGPGICHHGELGAAGGGHFACGLDSSEMPLFLELVHHELARGGFRPVWAL